MFFGFESLEELCAALLVVENCTCAELKQYGTISCETNQENEENSSISLDCLTSMTSFVGVVINLFVIWMQSKRKNSKSRYARLIVLLAVSDILFAILALLYHVPRFWTYDWIFGLIGCKIINSGMSLSAWIAISIILLIAIERYAGIVYPFRQPMKDSMMYSLLTSLFILAICTLIPRVIFLQLHIDDETSIVECAEVGYQNRTLHLWYNWSVIILYFLIPVAGISFLYAKILRFLSHQINQREQEESMKKLKVRRLKQNRRTMISLVAVLLTFVLFTFPNKSRWLMESYLLYDPAKKSIADKFYYVSEVLYPFHLAVNPLIYTSSDKRLRKEFRTYITRMLAVGRSSSRKNVKETTHLLAALNHSATRVLTVN